MSGSLFIKIIPEFAINSPKSQESVCSFFFFFFNVKLIRATQDFTEILASECLESLEAESTNAFMFYSTSCPTIRVAVVLTTIPAAAIQGTTIFAS